MNIFGIQEMGANVAMQQAGDNKLLFALEDEIGSGTMRCYQAFPGVFVMFNAFEMDTCVSGFRPGEALFCMDYCLEGRLEWELEDGSRYYIGAGEMQINSRTRHDRRFHFPLGCYRGITLCFFIKEAERALEGKIEGLSADLRALNRQCCKDGKPFMLGEEAAIAGVFTDLYRFEEENGKPLLQIKVLELLMLLQAGELSARANGQRYLTRAQAEKTKAVMRLITQNTQRRFPLEEISRQLAFPLTTMKACFKAMYGMGIYAYLRTWRMNQAAMLLRETEYPVMEIAMQMGYENASKFSAAFKAAANCTPREYRSAARRSANEARG